ncbi:hypothetical protein ACS0TY_031239 [Phlomoides rotata]
MEVNSQTWHSDLDYNKWVALAPSGLRYKHAAAIFDDKLYIIGGAHKGGYLSHCQVLDLKTLIRSVIKLKIEATNKDGPQLEVFPETSSHSMIKWKNRLLLFAGLTKSATYKVTVRFIDLESYTSGVVETFGIIPVSRRGQSVTLFGSKVIMFGGKDWSGRLLNDVHVLDLETMTWIAVETTYVIYSYYYIFAVLSVQCLKDRSTSINSGSESFSLSNHQITVIYNNNVGRLPHLDRQITVIFPQKIFIFHSLTFQFIHLQS